jgi:hypothetical protein
MKNRKKQKKTSTSSQSQDTKWLKLKPALTIIILIICVLIFYLVKTGEFPSLSLHKREIQFIESYYSRKSDVVTRYANLYGTGEVSLITFEKDKFFNIIFQPFKLLENPDMTIFSNFNNQVIILDKTDLGILNPFLSFIYPFKKILEIRPEPDSLLENNRLYDVEIIDLDADNKDELIITWLDYFGGSGGTMIKMIVGFQDKNPYLESLLPYNLFLDTENDSLEIAPLDTISFILNKKKIIKALPLIHTDNYLCLKNIDDDPKIEIINAAPCWDWKCHYCPQTWLLSEYQLTNKKVNLDPVFSLEVIPKADSIGLSQMHGFLFVPLAGEIYYNWAPSWLTIDDPKVAYYKQRVESPIFKYIKKQ